MSTIYYLGRSDGLGNRLIQLIRLQEYCETNNQTCIYIWTPSKNKNRHYPVRISFDNIEIKTSASPEERQKSINNSVKLQHSFRYPIKYKLNFNVPNTPVYDAIIHVRGTDRLVRRINHKVTDFSTSQQLLTYISKTIQYINNDNSISTYTIVSDDKKYIQNIKDNVHKKYVELPYDSNIENSWLDFYYLTKPTKYVVMCSQFSSYSITASILGNKKLMVFKNSINSGLPNYNPDYDIIDP